MDAENTMHLFGWRPLLRALGMLAGLLLLAGLVMGLIISVANFFDAKARARPTPVFIAAATSATTLSSATHAPPRGSPVELPSHPGRAMAVSFKNGSSGRARAGAGHGYDEPRASVIPSQQVGLSVDEYRETIGSGKKVYLPDPQGACALSGESAARLVSDLDHCLAPRAAR